MEKKPKLCGNVLEKMPLVNGDYYLWLGTAGGASVRTSGRPVACGW